MENNNSKNLEINEINIDNSLLVKKIKSLPFVYFLIIAVFVIFLIVASIYTNLDLANTENKVYGQITAIGLSLILAIAILFICYISFNCFIIEKQLKIDKSYTIYGYVFTVFFLLLLSYLLWNVALFHSRIKRGLPGLMAVIVILMTILFCYTIHKYSHDYAIFYIPLIILSLYIFYYTYNVTEHAWNPIIIPDS